MNIAELVTVLTQLSLGAAAWRLANRLAIRVDGHETTLADHTKRIGVLESAK